MNSIQTLLKTLLAIVLFVVPSISMAQITCVQSATATGLDNAPTLCTVTPVNCQGAGIVSSVTMDATIGNACMFGWYYYDLIVDGTTVATYLCDVTGYDLTSYWPFTTVTLQSADQNFIANTITLTLDVNVTYNANFCSGTPNAGGAVADEFVACANDSFEVNLNNQSTGLGLTYQWQSSPDNQNWTDMTNDTLLTLKTAINSDTYFRCKVECTASGMTDFSNSDFVAFGYCTTPSIPVCNTQFSGGVEVIDISGFPGIALSPVVLSFEYKGSMGFAGSYLTVTDYIGNVIGQLNGGSVACDTVIDSLVMTANAFNTLLAAGNGTIPLTITPTSVFANCPNIGTNVAYCISVSAKAVPFLLQNDGGTGDLLSPEVGLCALDSAVSFELHNVGSNNLTSIDIDWSVNGVLQIGQSWTGNLGSLMMDTISLGTYAGGFNDFDEVKIWVSNPNNAVDSNYLNDTIIKVLHPGLSGTYIIDHAGSGEFVSFNDALDAAYEYGLCGPVVFEVANGTYVEQLEIETDMINGASSINTIEFTSQSQDSSLVIVTHSPLSFSENFTLKLSNSEYVSFSHISFKSFGTSHSRVIWTDSDAYNNHISFSNCLFETTPSTSNSQHTTLAYLYSDSNNYWSFTNNSFIGGSTVIRIGRSGSDPDVGTVIENNHFSEMGYAAISATNQDSILISHNYMTSTLAPTSNSYAIYAYSIGSNCEISYNHVVGDADWPTYGMYLTNIDGVPASKVEVFNNRISLTGPSSKFGLYVTNVEHVNLTHNSIYSLGTVVDNAGVRFWNGSNITFENNIVQNYGLATGNAFWSNSESIFSSLDYNAYSVNVGNIATVDTLSYTTLTAWQAASTNNDSSVVVNTAYSDVIELTVCNDSLYQKGNTGSVVSEDFEGDPRMTTPCIGADEFMTINQIAANHAGYELCTGDTLTLSQYYFDVVEWNGSPTNEYEVTTPGVQVLYVSGTCGTNTISVTVSGQQQVSIADAFNCEGDSVVITPNLSNGTFIWGDGSTDSVFVADSAQMVTVQFTSNQGGCISWDTAEVTQSENVDLLVDSASFCEGTSFTLSGNIGGNYLWSTGETGTFITVDSTAMYSVTVTEQNCVSSDSTYVEEILNPIASFTDSIDGYTVYFTSTSQNGTSYDWDFGDGNSSTAENPVHTYNSSEELNYNVSLTVSNVCSDNTWSTWVTDGPGSVSEMAWEDQVSVYPNPMMNQLQVNISNVNYNSGQITITNTAGAKLHHRSLSVGNGAKFNIDVTDYAAGVYFVKVELDAGFTIRKVIKL